MCSGEALGPAAAAPWGQPTYGGPCCAIRRWARSLLQPCLALPAPFPASPQHRRPGVAADNTLHRDGGQRGGAQVGGGPAVAGRCTACLLRCTACPPPLLSSAPASSQSFTGRPGRRAGPVCLSARACLSARPSARPHAYLPCSVCLVEFDSHPEHGTLLAVGTAQGLKFYPKECQSEQQEHSRRPAGGSARAGRALASTRHAMPHHTTPCRCRFLPAFARRSCSALPAPLLPGCQR